MHRHLLPPANEVWGKVIYLQVCVCPQVGSYLVPGGVPGPGEAWSQRGLIPGRVPGPGGSLPPMATAAGGTHPTGIHSCSQC